MIARTVPAASQLVSYVVSFSASYASLCTRQPGEIDPSFRLPANELLKTIGGSSAFQSPRIYRSGGVTLIRSYLQVAQHISEQSPFYARDWQDRLSKTNEQQQQELWLWVKAAADGFIQAGYDVYDDGIVSGQWAEDALKRGLEIAWQVPRNPISMSIFPPPNMRIHLNQTVEHLREFLAQGDYRQAGEQIESIREQSSGAAVRYVDAYFQVLVEAYRKVPLGSRIHDLIASELYESGRREARDLFAQESLDLWDDWSGLTRFEKLKQHQLLWNSLRAGFRFRRLNNDIYLK